MANINVSGIVVVVVVTAVVLMFGVAFCGEGLEEMD